MQHPPGTRQAAKLQNIEGLRGLLALWVVVGHAVTFAAVPLARHGGIGRVLANGSFAVDVFIILSGFVISMLLSRQRESYGAFIVRRAFRLFPVYWLALALSLATLPLLGQLLRQLPWSHEHNDVRLGILAKSLDHFWAHLAAHVPLLHGVVPERVLPATGTAFIGQAWSLTLEWQFYLVAPFILVATRTSGRRTLGVLVAIGLCFAGAALMPQPSFLPSKLHLFVAGIISHLLLQERLSDRATAGVFLRNLAFIGLLFVPQRSLLIPWLIWMATLCSQVLPQSRRSALGMLSALLSHPVTCWLGRISYPIYCIHMVVLCTWGYALLFLLHVQSHLVYATALIGGGLVITVGAAWLVHRTLEEPMIAVGKRIVFARQPPRATAAAVAPLPETTGNLR